ncbi:hypothetical protein [Deinococcus sp. UYEF24]
MGQLRLAGLLQVEPATFEVQESLLNLEALVVFGERLERARFIAHDEPGFLSAEGMDGRDVDGSIALCREVHVVHHHQLTVLAEHLPEFPQLASSSVSNEDLSLPANIPVPAEGGEIGHQFLIHEATVGVDADLFQVWEVHQKVLNTGQHGMDFAGSHH